MSFSSIPVDKVQIYLISLKKIQGGAGNFTWLIKYSLKWKIEVGREGRKEAAVPSNSLAL